jgi:hypothetical protein
LTKLPEYWKAIVAVVGAVAVAVQAALTDSTITSAEWLTIAIAAITAVGVYAKANKAAG